MWVCELLSGCLADDLDLWDIDPIKAEREEKKIIHFERRCRPYTIEMWLGMIRWHFAIDRWFIVGSNRLDGTDANENLVINQRFIMDLIPFNRMINEPFRRWSACPPKTDHHWQFYSNTMEECRVREGNAQCPPIKEVSELQKEYHKSAHQLGKLMAIANETWQRKYSLRGAYCSQSQNSH